MTDDSIKEKPGLGEFVHTTRQEISKVTWPSRKDTVRMTFIIILFALAAGVFFLAVDSILGYAVSHFLGMNS
jgi:preprotein translocase subunit SecE